MQDIASGVVADVRDAPSSERSRTPWRLVARFSFPGGTTYDDLFVTLRDWRDDRRIERAIGADRLSRIQVQYKNKKGRGSGGEYTIAEIGAWELAISRGVERVGIRDDKLESLIQRYGTPGETVSYIQSVTVWFSSATGHEIKAERAARKARVPKKPKAAKPKAAKPKARKSNARPRKSTGKKAAKRKRRV